MRNILLTAILVLSMGGSGFADTAFFPPYQVPIPCAQGGTGLTSGTTNQVLAFTGSCTIAGTATPTLTGVTVTGSQSFTLPVNGVIGNNTASSNILYLGTSGQNTLLEMYNPNNAAGNTELATTGDSAGGISGTLFGVGWSGHNNLFALDSSGDIGLGGSISSGNSKFLLNGSAGAANTVLQSNGTSDTFTNTPSISGANITSATIPNAALVTAPVTNVTASGQLSSSGGTTPNITLNTNPTINTTNFAPGCTTYTPTDQSGASLTITINEATYCTIASRLIWISVVVTYPANASGVAAQLSLPVASVNNLHQRLATTVSLGLTNGITAVADTGGNIIFLNTINSGGANANVTLSSGQVGFSGIYQTQ